jgi:hypothetical protein
MLGGGNVTANGNEATLDTGTVANNDRCDIVHMPAIWAIRCNARFMRPEETVIQAPCTGFSTALVDYGLLQAKEGFLPDRCS